MKLDKPNLKMGTKILYHHKHMNASWLAQLSPRPPPLTLRFLSFRGGTSGRSHRGDRRVQVLVSEAVCSRVRLRRPRHPARNPVFDLQHLQRQRPVSRLTRASSSKYHRSNINRFRVCFFLLPVCVFIVLFLFWFLLTFYFICNYFLLCCGVGVKLWVEVEG